MWAKPLFRPSGSLSREGDGKGSAKGYLQERPNPATVGLSRSRSAAGASRAYVRRDGRADAPGRSCSPVRAASRAGFSFKATPHMRRMRCCRKPTIPGAAALPSNRTPKLEGKHVRISTDRGRRPGEKLSSK